MYKICAHATTHDITGQFLAPKTLNEFLKGVIGVLIRFSVVKIRGERKKNRALCFHISKTEVRF